MTSVPLLEGPRIEPLSGEAKHLILLLHGYGADGNDLIPLGRYWQPDFPDAVFVAPNAPEPCELSPFGRQWFSLAQYDPDLQRRDPVAGAEVFNKMTEGARRAQGTIDAFLSKELEAYGLQRTDMAFVGFSQGTMVSLYTGLREQQAPAGILGYSGTLVGADELASELTCRPPICLVHGEEDDIVRFPALSFTQDALKQAGLAVEAHARPGLGHGIDEKGLEIGKSFLTSILI